MKCAYRYCRYNTDVSGRKKYCSQWCGYQERRELENDSVFPVKKRTKDYFAMVVGSERAINMRGQGRRSGGMIRGGMGDISVQCTVEEYVEVNVENVIQHFKGIPGYQPAHILYGDLTRDSKEEIFKKLGIDTCIIQEN